jgi:hypothetical protein
MGARIGKGIFRFVRDAAKEIPPDSALASAIQRSHFPSCPNPSPSPAFPPRHPHSPGISIACGVANAASHSAQESRWPWSR